MLVIETDDQTVESMQVMDNVNSLIGDQGATFKNSFVNFSLCCPSRATFLTGQYAHNHGVLGNNAADRRLRPLRGAARDNNLAVWLQDAGYYTALIGKYLNGYANNPPVPPGWSEWHAAAPDDQQRLRLHAERERHAGPLRHRPGRLQAGRAHRQGGRLRRPPGAEARSRSSSGSPTRRRTSAARTRTRTRPSTATARRSRPPRHAHAFDSEPLPRPPELQRGRRLRQAGGDPEPAAA